MDVYEILFCLSKNISKRISFLKKCSEKLFKHVPRIMMSLMIFPRTVCFSYSAHICTGVVSSWYPPLRKRKNVFAEAYFTDLPYLTETLRKHYFFLHRLSYFFCHLFPPPSSFSISNAAFLLLGYLGDALLEGGMEGVCMWCV